MWPNLTCHKKIKIKKIKNNFFSSLLPISNPKISLPNFLTIPNFLTKTLSQKSELIYIYMYIYTYKERTFWILWYTWLWRNRSINRVVQISTPWLLTKRFEIYLIFQTRCHGKSKPFLSFLCFISVCNLLWPFLELGFKMSS